MKLSMDLGLIIDATIENHNRLEALVKKGKLFPTIRVKKTFGFPKAKLKILLFPPKNALGPYMAENGFCL